MDIAEVARRSGMPASTLRFYEEKGLIASIGRDGLRRRFAPSVLDQLALIALGRASGFTLDEIAQMFASDGSLNIDRTLLEARADDIERTGRRLAAMSKGLRHAAKCPAPSHLECPTFRRLMRAAAAGALEPPAAGPVHGRREAGRPASASTPAPVARARRARR
ncbi:MAG TPA: helix-turn-helix domain-containing protein [Albitalea sp.]|nr:helix-turn-helix domain-containing protein [Albitalea sp.]